MASKPFVIIVLLTIVAISAGSSLDSVTPVSRWRNNRWRRNRNKNRGTRCGWRWCRGKSVCVKARWRRRCVVPRELGDRCRRRNPFKQCAKGLTCRRRKCYKFM